MALSDVKVRSAKPEAKAYKLTDGDGNPTCCRTYLVSLYPLERAAICSLVRSGFPNCYVNDSG